MGQINRILYPKSLYYVYVIVKIKYFLFDLDVECHESVKTYNASIYI